MELGWIVKSWNCRGLGAHAKKVAGGLFLEVEEEHRSYFRRDKLFLRVQVGRMSC